MLKHRGVMTNANNNQEKPSHTTGVAGVQDPMHRTHAEVVVTEVVRKTSKRRKLVWIVAAVAFALVVGVSNYIYISHRTETKKVIKETYEERAARLGAEGDVAARALVSKPLAANVTAAEQQYYYATALRLKVQSGDSKATADYYINVIKVANVTVPLDLREQVVQCLVTSGYPADAKVLIRTIIAEYKATPVADPALQPYIDEKINQYTKMEQVL